MEPRTLQYLAEAAAGAVAKGQPALLVEGISTDSRQVRPGDLFVALAGDRFDGHEFITQAAALGARAVLTDGRPLPGLPGSCARIVTDNPRAALGRIAARYRRDYRPRLVAVGGSNGKTTTKELVASVLARRFAVIKSEASYNNDVGVPHTLLKLGREHQAGVLEVGTNHPGELAPLVDMVQPEFGVITSLGREHLEFFKDLDGVAAEEGWLAQQLPAQGVLFTQGDPAVMTQIVRRAACPVQKVGFLPGNDWRATEVRVGPEGTDLRVAAARGEYSGQYQIPIPGRHHAVNALLAIAVGAEMGLDPEEIRAGLAAVTPPRMRSQMRRGRGILLLDDSYNANADSMAAALETLRDLPCAGRRVAVLGDMAELGEEAESAHAEVGRRAAETGVDALFTVGRWASVLAGGVRASGRIPVFEFAEAGPVPEALRSYLRAGDLVLLKASRATRLEHLAEAILQEHLGAGDPLRPAGIQGGAPCCIT